MNVRYLPKKSMGHRAIVKAKVIGWVLLMTFGTLTTTPRPASAQALVAAMLEPNVIQALGLTEYQVQSLVSLYQQLEYFRAQGGGSCDPAYPPSCQEAFDTQRRQAEQIADIEQQGIQRILTAEQMMILNQLLQG